MYVRDIHTPAMDERIRRSRQQEKRGAARYNGTRNVGSGNQPFRKADVRGRDLLLIEYKRTDKKQITVKDSDLTTLFTQATLDGRVGVLGIELAGKHYVLLLEDDFDTGWRGAG